MSKIAWKIPRNVTASKFIPRTSCDPLAVRSPCVSAYPRTHEEICEEAVERGATRGGGSGDWPIVYKYIPGIYRAVAYRDGGVRKEALQTCMRM